MLVFCTVLFHKPQNLSNPTLYKLSFFPLLKPFLGPSVDSWLFLFLEPRILLRLPILRYRLLFSKPICFFSMLFDFIISNEVLSYWLSNCNLLTGKKTTKHWSIIKSLKSYHPMNPILLLFSLNVWSLTISSQVQAIISTIITLFTHSITWLLKSNLTSCPYIRKHNPIIKL